MPPTRQSPGRIFRRRSQEEPNSDTSNETGTSRPLQIGDGRDAAYSRPDTNIFRRTPSHEVGELRVSYPERAQEGYLKGRSPEQQRQFNADKLTSYEQKYGRIGSIHVAYLKHWLGVPEVENGSEQLRQALIMHQGNNPDGIINPHLIKNNAGDFYRFVREVIGREAQYDYLLGNPMEQRAEKHEQERNLNSKNLGEYEVNKVVNGRNVGKARVAYFKHKLGLPVSTPNNSETLRAAIEAKNAGVGYVDPTQSGLFDDLVRDIWGHEHEEQYQELLFPDTAQDDAIIAAVPYAPDEGSAGGIFDQPDAESDGIDRPHPHWDKQEPIPEVHQDGWEEGLMVLPDLKIPEVIGNQLDQETRRNKVKALVELTRDFDYMFDYDEQIWMKLDTKNYSERLAKELESNINTQLEGMGMLATVSKRMNENAVYLQFQGVDGSGGISYGALRSALKSHQQEKITQRKEQIEAARLEKKRLEQEEKFREAQERLESATEKTRSLFAGFRFHAMSTEKRVLVSKQVPEGGQQDFESKLGNSFHDIGLGYEILYQEDDNTLLVAFPEVPIDEDPRMILFDVLNEVCPKKLSEEGKEFLASNYVDVNGNDIFIKKDDDRELWKIYEKGDAFVFEYQKEGHTYGTSFEVTRDEISEAASFWNVARKQDRVYTLISSKITSTFMSPGTGPKPSNE